MAFLSRRRSAALAGTLVLAGAGLVAVAPAAQAVTPPPWRFTVLSEHVSVPAGGSAALVKQCPGGYTPVSGGVAADSGSIRRQLEYPNGVDGTYHIGVHNTSAEDLPVIVNVECAWTEHAAASGIASTSAEFARNGAGRAGG